MRARSLTAAVAATVAPEESFVGGGRHETLFGGEAEGRNRPKDLSFDRKPFRLIEAVIAVATRRWQKNKVVIAEIAGRAKVEVRTAEYWIAGGGMGLDAYGRLMGTDLGPDIFDAWIESQPPEIRQRWEKHLEKRALRAELLRREAEIAAAKREHGL